MPWAHPRPAPPPTDRRQSIQPALPASRRSRQDARRSSSAAGSVVVRCDPCWTGTRHMCRSRTPGTSAYHPPRSPKLLRPVGPRAGHLPVRRGNDGQGWAPACRARPVHPDPHHSGLAQPNPAQRQSPRPRRRHRPSTPGPSPRVVAIQLGVTLRHHRHRHRYANSSTTSASVSYWYDCHKGSRAISLIGPVGFDALGATQMEQQHDHTRS
jgi:hypothetical protein